MNIVLEEYNKFAAKTLATIQELEDESKDLQIETVSATKEDIVFKRYCSCCARDLDKKLHPIHYFVIEIAKCDCNGDVDINNAVVIDCGLL